jgi:hypothetical protein
VQRDFEQLGWASGVIDVDDHVQPMSVVACAQAFHFEREQAAIGPPQFDPSRLGIGRQLTDGRSRDVTVPGGVW